MPSPSLLRSLPKPEAMQSLLRAYTMLDAIVNSEFRAFEWHPKWGKGEQMGALKDGSGNSFFAWFSKKGTVVRGFDHESKMSPFQHDPPVEWPGLTEGLPKALEYAKTEPAFIPEELTFMLWNTGSGWKCGDVKLAKGRDPDGAEQLLECFRTPFAKFVAKFFHEKFDRNALKAIESGQPITRAMIDALTEEPDLEMVKEEAKLCSYSLSLRSGERVGVRGRKTQ